MAALREAEREQFAGPLSLQPAEHILRGREQVGGRRRLGPGGEVAVARHGRVAEAGIVGGDEDEAGACEHRTARWPLEALAPGLELAGDVGIRRGVVVRGRRAVYVGDDRHRPGPPRHGDVPGRDRRRGPPLAGKPRIDRAVGDLVRVEPEVDVDAELIGEVVEVLVELDPRVEVGARGSGRRVRRDSINIEETAAVTVSTRPVHAPVVGGHCSWHRRHAHDAERYCGK